MPKEDLLEKSGFLSGLNLSGGNNLDKAPPAPATKPVEPTPAPEPDKPVAAKNEPKKDKIEKPKRVGEEVVPLTLEITSQRRVTCGFHMYQEYEDAVEAIRCMKGAKKTGEVCEGIISFYIRHLPDDKRKELFRLIRDKGKQDDF